MKMPRQVFLLVWVLILLCSCINHVCHGQDYEDESTPAAPPPEQEDCDGIFIMYNFIERIKEYPHVKNASAQSWAFKSQMTVLNAGLEELKAWKVFIGFQHNEILVGASGAVSIDGEDLPAKVGNNGTTLAGYPQADLKTSIETAGDINQIQARIELTGTQFGVKPPGVPMPKKIRLENDGYKCPAARRRGTNTMLMCCVKDKKHKSKQTKTKFLPRQYGDLTFTYDVLQAYEGNYLAQVTMDNNHPLGRLDHWNLTWEWMRGEFIYSMRGAYTHKKDPSECIYGVAGQYYKDFDFSQVMNCEKKPVIADLPADRANDTKVGKLPYCCRNGTLLPALMDESKSRSIFQLQVYKIPPDMNRTALTPPQRWKIDGVINPEYKCGAPIRVDPTEFPDPSGLQATSSAIASWQVSCNITRPKAKESRCCVSFSAYYNESIIPCNTCACGCDNTDRCNPKAHAMLLPPEAILVPFENRTAKAKAWAKIKHYPVYNPMPCPDNCGVSLNWHINSDYKQGWTARITLFNWDDFPFEDWFAAIQMKKAFPGYEKVYSFNGTKLPQTNDTIFFQGTPGMNFLVGETNGTNPLVDPRVPGKQQSVISFTKKTTPGINILRGDGFPSKVFFNGEECSLPSSIPLRSAGYRFSTNSLPVVVIGIVTFLLMTELFH
ncbi:COBRA-like protein 10 [Syzygium oleosum]|uniref:COBRA-like protein 10 n=1 Tax=Syzygium oleosum TaxID=219896 RepID=UPI0011D2830B|nr:COBRA-like protein 10 [Syzygium oleosum]